MDGQIVCTLRLPFRKFSRRCDRAPSKHELEISGYDKSNIDALLPFNYTLHIKNFQDSSDDGVYSCSTEGDVSIGRPVMIVAMQRPAAEYPVCTFTSSNGSFIKGMETELNCNLPGGSPFPELQWYRTSAKSGEMLENVSGILHTNNATLSRIITMDDMDATYTCVASHPTFDESHVCTVGPMTVFYAPRVSVQTASIDYSEKNNTIFMRILCEVDATPKSTQFKWSVNNVIVTSMQIDSNSPHIIELILPFVSDLRLSSSVVVCEASNIVGSGYAKYPINNLSNFSEGATPLPLIEKMTSQSLIGPLLGAFFAGICLVFIIIVIVFLLKTRNVSFRRRNKRNENIYTQPSSPPSNGSTDAATPYHVGYIHREQNQTKQPESKRSDDDDDQHIYEDPGREETEPTVIIRKGPDSSGYTALLRKQTNSNVYQDLVEDQNADGAEYEDPIFETNADDDV
uniref:Cell adhesion molecule 1-like n=1 Tax=Saccoglossus kowalevskii TaxID=10224 RepID=A0ABM0LTS9_SACKO|nr:PREDICTED: cell adhesion molecule 1-like [Saccoglossus kowalevskii]